MYQQKSCHFCKKGIFQIDYKDGQFLRRYISSWSKIKPGKTTGTCSKHQRELTRSIKRARFLAILPYVTR